MVDATVIAGNRDQRLPRAAFTREGPVRHSGGGPSTLRIFPYGKRSVSSVALREVDPTI